ncbi:hypothetical protein GPECTOR_44g13 [Gonium pectorale]|uniref:Uncharacterized protein n=1 Tax=Gonium pectorale TaxID=33097 RepID=A0A150G919_GONPE|nr:hypothetical protein GPECTOR_44g13 [Gonium pectorale]|eukprot:KXZ46334.1 hypothetical protein GPECTOR_44g13 [Gonium pectorale]
MQARIKLEMALCIIKSGKADLEVALPDGTRPILQAVKTSVSAPLVNALLAAGANGSKSNKAGEVPLLVAIALAGRDSRRAAALRDMALALAGHASVDRNVQDARTGDTALHLAVPQAFEPLVELLIKQGANTNLRNKAGSSPLHTAMEHAIVKARGNATAQNIVLLMVKGGGDVALTDAAGWTALHMSVGLGQGSLALFRAVLRRGPVLDACTGDKGCTALHLATRRAAETGDAADYVEMGKALLAEGADPNIAASGHGGSTALHMAIEVEAGSQAMFSQLLDLKTTNLDTRDKAGNTPLHAALARAGAHGRARACNMAVAIVQSGRANVRLTNARQRQPLAAAVVHGLLPAVAALLAAGAPCNDPDPVAGGVSPLLIAAAGAVAARSSAKDAATPKGGGGSIGVHDHVGTMRELMRHGRVDVNVVGKDRRTTLHVLLSTSACADLAGELLARQPNLDVQDAGGDTPLHLALKRVHPANTAAAAGLVTAMVVRSGASLVLQDGQGNTAMHLAMGCIEEVFLACAERCVNKDILNKEGLAPLHMAVAMREPKRLATLLHSGGKCSVDLRVGGKKDTALHMALKLPEATAAPMVKALVVKGCNVNLTDPAGHTGLTLALHHRLSEGLVGVVLGAQGVNVNAREPQHGRPAVQVAMLNDQAGVVTALLQKKADTKLRNNDGDALLHVALKPEAARDRTLPDSWKPKYVRMLVQQHGVDPNLCDGAGAAPLVILLRPTSPYRELVSLAHVLLDGGAKPCSDINSTSGMGWIHMACEDPLFISKWKSKGGNLNQVADFNAIRAHVDRSYESSHPWNSNSGCVADGLFSKVNSRVTAITLAVLGGWDNSVNALLGSGVSPNVGSLCGPKAVTPMMVALLQNRTDMAAVLQQKGASIDGENDGVNPMCMAIQVAKGLIENGCGAYSLRYVPSVVEDRLGRFIARQAREVLTDALQEEAAAVFEDEVLDFDGTDVGADIAADFGYDIASEIGTELVSQMAGFALDMFLPGFSLIRLAFALGNDGGGGRAARPRPSDKLKLAALDVMEPMRWLLKRGCKVTLADRGMSEMLGMIVSDEGGAGWQWAGLALTWPRSFEPLYSNGVTRITEDLRRKVREGIITEEQFERQLERAKRQWCVNVKVTITMKELAAKRYGK